MTKKGYKSPKIEKVKLVAEEAVLVNCKSPTSPMNTGPNPSFTGCSTPGDPNGCMVLGS